MSKFLRRLLAGVSPTGRALRQAHEAAEVARLSAINRDPPPGEGWRVADQDSEGKWTVWNGPRPVASFWDENDAAAMARRNNQDPRPNPVHRDDGKYCVNCGSHETDASLKARGYVSCCPERYVIPEVWEVSAGRLATGEYHLWKPGEGLPTVTDDSWPERADAQAVADRRNRLAQIVPAPGVYRPDQGKPTTPEMADVVDAIRNSPEPYVARALHDAQTRGTSVTTGRLTGPTPEERARYKAEAKAEFLNVPVPDGLRMVVGPHKSPDDYLWWTFDRSGPVRGYTRKSNAQAAADRANNAPQT